jgi:hypothetical protein
LAGNDVLRASDDVSVISLVINAILEAKETEMGFALLIPALKGRAAFVVEKGLEFPKMIEKLEMDYTII